MLFMSHYPAHGKRGWTARFLSLTGNFTKRLMSWKYHVPESFPTSGNTRKTPGKTQHSPAVTPGKRAVHFTFSSTWQTRFNSAFWNLFYHRYQQRVNRPLTAVFYLGPNITCQEFPQLYFDYLTSNNFAKKPVSVNITTEIDFSVISVQ